MCTWALTLSQAERRKAMLEPNRGTCPKRQTGEDEVGAEVEGGQGCSGALRTVAEERRPRDRRDVAPSRERRDDRADPVRRRGRVGVQSSDDIRGRRVVAGRARRPDSRLPLHDHPGAVATRHRSGVVRRAVVHDDHRVGRHGLGGEATQAATQVLRVVPDRDDHGDRRHPSGRSGAARHCAARNGRAKPAASAPTPSAARSPMVSS